MAYNPLQSSNQSQTHTLQQSAYPPPGSGMSRPLSGYSVPSQSYDPRWYQRPSQQPTGFQFAAQQALPRSSHSQQRLEQPPYSQPFRQMPSSPLVQSGYSPMANVRPPSTVLGAPTSHHTSPLAVMHPTPPLPPSSFHPPAPYSSPPHPQNFFQSASPASPPTCTRRPLPTPKPRPESLPPPSSHTPQIQAPAPSRPAILTNSESFVSADPPSALSSPSSSSSSGSRRPLPTPRLRNSKHASLDFRMRSSSPVKASIEQQLLPSLSRLPATSSTHNAPAPDAQSDTIPPPTALTIASARATTSDNNTTGPSSPTKFVPLWKRELQTSSSGANGPAAVERRSTVSGPPVLRADRAELPDRMRKDVERTQTSTRRPLPSPQTKNGEVILSPTLRSAHNRIPASSVADEINGPSHSDTDDEPIVFADPEGVRRTPSPQYGIRDLPSRPQTVVRNRENTKQVGLQNGADGPTAKEGPTAQRAYPVRSATLPQPPSSPPSQNPHFSVANGTSSSISDRSHGGQSLTFRLAALGLAEELSTSQARQQSNSHWPANAPHPPRTPATQDQPYLPDTPKKSSGLNRRTAAPPHSPGIQNPPSPRRDFVSPEKSTYGVGMKHTAIQREKQRAFVDLDDAPPPSLRRSPSPARPSSDTLPSIQISGSPPQRQWTPSKNSRAESSNHEDGHSRPADVPIISTTNNHSSGAISALGTMVSVPAPPSISVSSPEPPSISFSPPHISISDPASAAQSSDSQPPRGQYGSRHTQIQETPGPKRTLPPVPPRVGGLLCGGCGGSIIGRIVSAMGVRWHPGCFRCTTCNELLEHVSSYEHEGKPYCHLDYHETFAPRCFHCKTAIIDERFITLDDPALGKRTYHEQHFFCAECGDPFLAPSGTTSRMGELNVSGDGEFEDDNVCFTVYKGHPYCEACHVRLRMPKCKSCKRSIRDGMRAVEALGGKWCWECFVCASCEKPFEDPAFFLRDNKPFCEPCFSLMLRNEV